MVSWHDCSIILSLHTRPAISIVNEPLPGKYGLAPAWQKLTPNMKNTERVAVVRSYTGITQWTHLLWQSWACHQRGTHTKYRLSVGYLYPRFGHLYPRFGRSQPITVGLHSLERALFSLGASELRGKATEQRREKDHSARYNFWESFQKGHQKELEVLHHHIYIKIKKRHIT